MEDTPQHVRALQLKLWLEKPIEERLSRTVKDIDDMRKAFRVAKPNLGVSQCEVDPVEEYIKRKEWIDKYLNSI